MADIVSCEKRSRMMAGIKNKNTKPELLIRTELFHRGVRYRIHSRQLPGNPDIVLPKYRAVIFIHGCFWHNHNCHLFKWPSSRPEFWEKKLSGNKERDQRVLLQLQEMGWRILRVWECAVKGKARKSLPEIADEIIDWLQGDIALSEIGGRHD